MTTDYTITKNENNTQINIPTGKKYRNKLNNNKYLNSKEGIKLLSGKNNWKRVGNAYLENITLEGELVEAENMTLNFKTQTGTSIPLTVSTKPSELLATIDENISLDTFYLDYLSPVGARVHLADYINTVLVDLYENKTVLEELIEETEVTPTPTEPDTPTTPEGQEALITTDILNSKIKFENIGISAGAVMAVIPTVIFYDTTGTPLTMPSRNLFEVTQITFNETDISPLTTTQYNGNPCSISGMATIPVRGIPISSEEIPFTITVQYVPTQKTYTLRGVVDPSTKVVTRTDSHSNGGGAIVSSDKCIKLPSGNVYLQADQINVTTKYVVYKILYQDGTPYDLTTGILQRRDSPYKAYWVEDTTLPSAATYEAPYISIDELTINGTTLPIGNSTTEDVNDDQFKVYIDNLTSISVHNDIRLKCSVTYPDGTTDELTF